MNMAKIMFNLIKKSLHFDYLFLSGKSISKLLLNIKVKNNNIWAIIFDCHKFQKRLMDWMVFYAKFSDISAISWHYLRKEPVTCKHACEFGHGR
jgi:hypothetical protein